MTKILLLNDTIDHENWGAHACADTLKDIIRDAIPDVSFISVLSHWTTDRFFHLSRWLGGGFVTNPGRITRRFAKPVRFLPAVADEFDRVADNWCNGKGGPFAQEFLYKLDQSDVVVFNAEGSSYNNNSSAIRCLFALWLTETRFQKPAFFTNGSLTLTVVHPILNAMVERTFQSLSGVSVREPCSLENALKWAPSARALMHPDSVFYLAKKNCQEPEHSGGYLDQLKDRPYFCFSMSMLTSHIASYKDFGIKTTGLFDLIKGLQKIVPDAVLMAKDPADRGIIKDLAESTGSHYFGPDHHYSALIPLYQNARFIVSGRYHHLILAAIAGCPGIPLRTTSHKVDGLCKLLHPLIGSPFDPTWLRPSIQSITQRASDILASGEPLRRSLQEKAIECGEHSAGIGEMIRKGIFDVKMVVSGVN